MTHADRDSSERPREVPAGLPLHEPADRDGDNVPSDRVRAYAEAIASVMGVQTRYLDPRLARAVMAVADREQAELLAEIARLRGEIDAWKTVVENDTSIQGAMRRTISRVASVCDDWQSGHEPVHHRGYIADLERALRGPEPTEERPLPLHRTEAGYPNCSTCDGGGCLDCTDPA